MMYFLADATSQAIETANNVLNKTDGRTDSTFLMTVIMLGGFVLLGIIIYGGWLGLAYLGREIAKPVVDDCRTHLKCVDTFLVEVNSSLKNINAHMEYQNSYMENSSEQMKRIANNSDRWQELEQRQTTLERVIQNLSPGPQV